LFCAAISVFCFICSGVHAGETNDRSEQLHPIVTTAELVVGQNRFAFGLLQANQLIEKAEVELRLYAIEGSQTSLSAQLRVPYRLVESAEHKPSLHRHADGTAHVHDAASSVRGLYVAQLDFSRAGTWGIELLVKPVNGPIESVRFAVTVVDQPHSPLIGSAAPRSRNLIAQDVKNLREIDTSPKPDPRLHQVRIADAIAQGKPQLIVFATPQFCTSRMCGPVVDTVRGLLPAYGKRVAFVHQEIWQDFASKKMFATVEEWRLDTEPWIFIVDGKGIIRTKFEGLVTKQELVSALDGVLQSESAN
jgi:hypothetical protein